MPGAESLRGGVLCLAKGHNLPFALNSSYKFTDPLGLIPSSTGACGGWCQNYAADRWGGSAEFDSLAGAPPIWPFIYEVTRKTTITIEEDWVIRNPEGLEERINNGFDGFTSRNADGSLVTNCATLPQAWDAEQTGVLEKLGQDYKPNKAYRRTSNWVMGAAVIEGMDIKKGTVLATFNRESKIYENKPTGNHTVIFLMWTNGGMKVMEQGPSWKPRIREIRFDSTQIYYNDAGRFNVVRVKTQITISGKAGLPF